MNQMGKALADSIVYINLGVFFVLGGLLLSTELSEPLNSSFPALLVVLLAISLPIIFFGVKRFNRYKVYFKTDIAAKKLMYSGLVPNVIGFVLLSVAISLLFAHNLMFVPFVVIISLIGCGLLFLSLKRYRDFIPKQIVQEPNANSEINA